MEDRERGSKERYEARLLAEKRLLLGRFLSVADNLERALRYKDSECGLREGLVLTHRQMAELLRAEAVEEMESLGKPFDPRYHEAVQVVEGKGEPVVVEEWQKGYLHQGGLLRPAKVTVAQARIASPDQQRRAES